MCCRDVITWRLDGGDLDGAAGGIRGEGRLICGEVGACKTKVICAKAGVGGVGRMAMRPCGGRRAAGQLPCFGLGQGRQGVCVHFLTFAALLRDVVGWA